MYPQLKKKKTRKKHPSPKHEATMIRFPEDFAKVKSSLSSFALEVAVIHLW